MPPSRKYTISGEKKLSYPQTRIMKTNFPDNMNSNVGEQLKKGEIVTVVGAASQRRGHLLVESKNGNYFNF